MWFIEIKMEKGMAHYIAVAKEIGTIMVFYVLHKSCEPVARSSLPQFCHNKAFFPDSWEQIKKNSGSVLGNFCVKPVGFVGV